MERTEFIDIVFAQVRGESADKIIKAADELVADRPTGEWKRHELWEMPWYTCSECNYHGRNDFNYCPNCGAYMKGGDE